MILKCQGNIESTNMDRS